LIDELYIRFTRRELKTGMIWNSQEIERTRLFEDDVEDDEDVTA